MVISIIILVVLIVVTILVVILRMKIRDNRSKCPKCKEQYNYDRDIAWEVLYIRYQGDRAYDHVKITCHCNKCGNKDVFEEDFHLQHDNKVYSLDRVIQAYLGFCDL